MSWTTVCGHRPVGPRGYERQLGNQDSPLVDDVVQQCTCGELYDCEHVAARVVD